MRLSYSTASGTFLVTGQNNGTRLLELNQHGVSLGNMVVLPPSGPVIIASHGTMPEWLVATLAGTRYIFGTFTPFGGSNARLPDCLTPDPFVVFGGGTCINQGWYPPGMIQPSPPPTPSPGGCLTPDPFVALGGGTCVNGGWYPPSMTQPTPPPTPVPGGCLTPDPFVALGGGRCVNGGWYPPGA